MADNGAKAQVPRPRLELFATALEVAPVQHPTLGKLAHLHVDAGNLAVDILLPAGFASGIGQALTTIGTGVIVAQPGQLPKEPPHG